MANENKVFLYLITLAVVSTSVISAPIPPGRRPSPQCDPGEENDCAKCYDTLVNELIISDHNRFTLQQSFYPPDAENPVFVEVTYIFTRNLTGDGATDYDEPGPSEIWFWTTASSYLFQPIKSLQFTSLLFSDPHIRSTHISLYLQPRCQNSSIDMKMLLTHRLKLYAKHQTIAADIDDDYNAQGQSVVTLALFHLGNATKLYPNEHVTSYTLSLHIILPILMFLFIFLLFYHVLDRSDLYKVQNKVDMRVKNRKNKRYNHFSSISPSKKNLWIITMALSSFAFVIYVLVLDIVALSYWHFYGDEEIFHNPSEMDTIDEMVSTSKLERDLVRTKLQMEYAIPFIMISYDLFVLVNLVIFVGGILCKKWAPKWEYIMIGPLACIGIHLYHIILGFIHNPEHATSIAVFYGLVITIFLATVRVAYVSLYSCILPHIEQTPNSNTDSAESADSANSTTNPAIHKTTQSNKSKKRYCIKCWCCMKLPKKWLHPLVLLGLCIVSALIAGLIVYVVVLFVINPVNNAIEGAPNSLISINQTALIFLGAAVTYKIIQNEKSTALSILVNAVNSTVKNKTTQSELEYKLVKVVSKQYLQKAALNFFEITTTALAKPLLDIDQGEADQKVQDVTCQLFLKAVDQVANGNWIYENEREVENDLQRPLNSKTECVDKIKDLVKKTITKTFPEQLKKTIDTEAKNICIIGKEFKGGFEQLQHDLGEAHDAGKLFFTKFFEFISDKELDNVCEELFQNAVPFIWKLVPRARAQESITIPNTQPWPEQNNEGDYYPENQRKYEYIPQIGATQRLLQGIVLHKRIGEVVHDEFSIAVKSKTFLNWEVKNNKEKNEAIGLYILNMLKRYMAVQPYCS